MIAAVGALFLGAHYNADDIDSATRGWARLAFWIALAATPAFLIATIVNIARAARAQSAGAFTIACPSCGGRQELSGIFRKRFNLTCPACYAVVDGSEEAHAAKRHCDYCHLDWFGTPAGPCPSCRGSGPGSSCPHCKAAIHRDAIGCVSCGAWLSEAESGFESGTGSYDPVRFSARLARTYALGIWAQVEPQATGLDELLAPVKNPGALDAAKWGRIGATLSEPKSTLPKFALAVEWTRRPGADRIEPFPPEIAEGLAKLDANIERCNAGGMKLDDELRAARRARESLAPA